MALWFWEENEQVFLLTWASRHGYTPPAHWWKRYKFIEQKYDDRGN